MWTLLAGAAVVAGVLAILFAVQPRQEAAPAVDTPGSVQVELQAPALPLADQEFNGSGYSLVTLGSGTFVATDVQGRLLVMGRSAAEGVPRVGLWRFTVAGKLDPTFGAGGSALAPTASAAGTPVTGEFGQGLLIESDGHFDVAGYSQDGEGRLHLALWRFSDSGRPDPTFGGRGVVSLTGSAGRGADDSGKGVALDARGRIVVVGSSWPNVATGPGSREYMTVWRFTPTGELDRGFFGKGTLTVPDTRGNAVAVDREGRILVAGATYGPTTQWTMAVWRFLPDGSADPEWNNGQVVTVRLPERDWLAASAAAVAVARDGRVVVLGSIYDRSHLSDLDDVGVQVAGIWRLNSDGTPDATFGQNRYGLVTLTHTAGGKSRRAGDHGRDLALDGQGRIVVAGFSRDARGIPLLTVWRRTASGAPDPAFGRIGALVQRDPPGNVEDGPNALAHGVAVDALGRVVVTGTVRIGNKPYLALWRVKP
jgi:uncharacterized delta-60 repeat protein